MVGNLNFISSSLLTFLLCVSRCMKKGMQYLALPLILIISLGFLATASVKLLMLQTKIMKIAYKKENHKLYLILKTFIE